MTENKSLGEIVREYGLAPLLERLRTLATKRDELNSKLQSTEPELLFCQECGAPAIKVKNMWGRYWVCSRYHEAAEALWNLDVEDPRRESYLKVRNQHKYEYSGTLLTKRPNPEYEKLIQEREKVVEEMRKVFDEFERRLRSLPLSKDERDYIYALAQLVIEGAHGYPFSGGIWCHED
jgi:ssDNA-binding Zn-finger/Zn-ribbon topoisomerase 1